MTGARPPNPNNGDEETKAALLNDEISINAADKKTNEQKRVAEQHDDDADDTDGIADNGDGDAASSDSSDDDSEDSNDNGTDGDDDSSSDTGYSSGDDSNHYSKKHRSDDDDTSGDGFSDSLEDNSGNPGAVTIPSFSDGIERPRMTFEEQERSDGETRARQEGYEKCYKEKQEAIQEMEQKILDTASACFALGLKFALSEVARGRTPNEVYHDERVTGLSGEQIIDFQLPDDAEGIIAGL